MECSGDGPGRAELADGEWRRWDPWEQWARVRAGSLAPSVCHDGRGLSRSSSCHQEVLSVE